MTGTGNATPGRDGAPNGLLSEVAASAGSLPERRPFRAADVLTGSIDQRRPAATPARGRPPRKQVSAQLEPSQVRLLGELHARLNATATARIEKSDLIGLGIELLAAVLDGAGEGLAPAPGQHHGAGTNGQSGVDGITDLAELRAYVRTHVRAYDEGA